MDNNTSLIGGISAVNNGAILRSYNAGKINSSSILTGGISGVNNGTITNVYNEGLLACDYTYQNQILAGLVANNKGAIRFAYNNSRLITRVENSNMKIYGITYNNGGVISDVYYNKNTLSTAIDTANGIEYLELANKENEIFTTWDFEKVWYFESDYISCPKLTTCYDYLGNIEFVVEFGAGINADEKLLLIEVISSNNQSYCLAVRSNGTVVLEKLSSGAYQIQFTTLLGVKYELEENVTTTITLNESTGEIASIKVLVSKTTTQGYYDGVIL